MRRIALVALFTVILATNGVAATLTDFHYGTLFMGGLAARHHARAIGR